MAVMDSSASNHCGSREPMCWRRNLSSACRAASSSPRITAICARTAMTNIAVEPIASPGTRAGSAAAASAVRPSRTSS